MRDRAERAATAAGGRRRRLGDATASYRRSIWRYDRPRPRAHLLRTGGRHPGVRCGRREARHDPFGDDPQDQRTGRPMRCFRSAGSSVSAGTSTRSRGKCSTITSHRHGYVVDDHPRAARGGAPKLDLDSDARPREAEETMYNYWDTGALSVSGSQPTRLTRPPACRSSRPASSSSSSTVWTIAGGSPARRMSSSTGTATGPSRAVIARRSASRRRRPAAARDAIAGGATAAAAADAADRLGHVGGRSGSGSRRRGSAGCSPARAHRAASPAPPSPRGHNRRRSAR